MSRRAPWVRCREEGCGTKLVFATRVGTSQRLPYEYESRETFSDAAAWCDVLIGGSAFPLADAIEHFQTRGDGMSEEAARELVAGYPSHRRHTHDPNPTEPEGDNAA